MFSDTYYSALKFAIEAHKNQVRKGSTIPYITHLTSVSNIVAEIIEYTDFNPKLYESIVIAALLHDIIEDTPYTYDYISFMYGKYIADIVLECSESKDKKLTWKERKTLYLQELPNKSTEALFISCADKTHNLRTIGYSKDYEKDFWGRFNASYEDIFWYYKELENIYRKNVPSILFNQFYDAYETVFSLK